ncbi:hypothetical protein CANCADRAFT_113949 [Tortispora caseinolytica NRRL Y-17796]|uniref:cystathionine gamma-lyase n=1 Tax=Tortispora caseinolytica NRRL Y-17796 TaxID=767744 RepID=A0A1E4TGW9_9ASCO|nr:hypothetical protein CANCADRAFT_113949 [Tortispora caseinolytica NRRL Y-17796]
MTADSFTNEYGFGTFAVHAGAESDPVTGAVISPISLSTTFAQTEPGAPIGYEYSRSANPNREAFEKAVAALEKGRHGLAFSSGSAATAVVLQSLTPGSHVISVADVYGGTHRYFTKVAHAHNVEVTLVHDIVNDFDTAIKDNTKLVWIESPSNPTLSITDIQKVADLAHAKNIQVVVDNTFASSYIQNPLTLGADIVVHSVTKYLNGHSDVVMGIAVTNSDAIHERLRFLQNAIGAVPSPFDSWLAHRGLKTLHLRSRQASLSAQAIAEELAQSPLVVAVNYPGLKSHKGHNIVLKQHRDGLGGGMISFRVVGGAAGAAKFCSTTKIFTLAESLGGIESLCEVPAVMTHSGISKEERAQVGVYDDLIRLSVGIEDTEDLLNDIQLGLEAASKA